VGICFHVGSQQHDPTAWDEPLAATGRLRNALRALGSDLDVVDLGGGFPALGTVDAVPAVRRYGEEIRDSLRRHLGDDLPEVMAEPGRFLVADAGVLETEVVLVTERAGARWVYVDAGLFSGLAETMGEAIRYRITAHRDGVPLTGERGPVVVAGPTCDSVDVLYREHRPALPLELRAGDRLRFHAAGAYTTSYSSVGFNGFEPLRELYR
jgi:ornithine decarboxylase